MLTRFIEFVQNAETTLYGQDQSATQQIHNIYRRGMDISQFDPQIKEQVEQLKSAQSIIEECIFDLRRHSENVSINSEELNKMEETLSSLRKVQKKYGPSVDEILQNFQQMGIEIEELQNSDETLSQLQKERGELQASLETMGSDLHKRRVSGSSLLSDGVNDELFDLNMKGVHFQAVVEKLDQMNSHGFTQIEFGISNSCGEKPRALSKSASGGELSRILLSVKRVIGSSEKSRTYLFDEVDSGISGPTAEKVGRKLKTIARGQQVICITHLPQVASHGDAHFYIEKNVDESVAMEVIELSVESRVKEIARLISGEKLTETSLAHAENLIKASI